LLCSARAASSSADCAHAPSPPGFLLDLLEQRFALLQSPLLNALPPFLFLVAFFHLIQNGKVSLYTRPSSHSTPPRVFKLPHVLLHGCVWHELAQAIVGWKYRLAALKQSARCAVVGGLVEGTQAIV
jgi:hypothetical protein